jgi:hypothetical protein
MNVSLDKLQVKFKGVDYFKQNMTYGASILHVAKSQELVAYFMSCRSSVKSEPKIWQRRNRCPPLPSVWTLALFSAVMFPSHSTSQAAIDLSAPGNIIRRNTVELNRFCVL